jgi:hypothetical protein
MSFKVATVTGVQKRTKKKIATKKILQDVLMGISYYDDGPMVLSF